ncbi:MAG: hypothetical protein GXO74_12010, partial [Calditrichaeota bacterium]|nr:hypothetical protein [Calditrichota bacterium]
MKLFIQIILTMGFWLSMNMSEGWNQELGRGDIFHEDFRSEKLTNWKDMTAWGFGVWQIKDGKLISVDSQEPEKGIVAILPDFKDAIVNRDFSAVMRFKPIAKKDFLFIIDFRHQGVSNYRLEIDKEGRISIVKNLVAHLPRKLFQTCAGEVKFDQWQWLRLDVRGENPVRIGAKIWQGEKSDEPKFYTAFASDLPGLIPENLNFALTVMQSGGSRVEIDNFDIYSKIPVQKIWRWHAGENQGEEKICQRAYQFFQKSELQKAKSLLLKLKTSPAVANNLALIEAERGNWSEALNFIHSAMKLSKNDEIISENAKWLWRASLKGGLVQQNQKMAGYVRLEKQVFLSPKMTKIEVFANKSFAQLPGSDLLLKIKIFNSEQNEIKLIERNAKADEFGEIYHLEVLDIAEFDDGKYQLRAELESAGKMIFLGNVQFEILFQEFEKFAHRLEKLEKWYDSQMAISGSAQEKNDLANLNVMLIKLKQQLDDCDAPGNFSLYRDKIEAALTEAEQAAAELKVGRNPFANQKGTFLRGYYSEIDGRVQGYALFVPEKYDAKQPFPLVVNL